MTLTNVPDFNRSFNGFELMARKRMADNWMLNSSFSFNSTTVNYGNFPGSQPSTAAAAITEDPTNREQRNGYQYDYLTAGSGIGNVYVNAKWLFKLSGMYQAPWGINLSAFYNARQGYPQELTVLAQTPYPAQTNCRPTAPARWTCCSTRSARRACRTSTTSTSTSSAPCASAG